MKKGGGFRNNSKKTKQPKNGMPINTKVVDFSEIIPNQQKAQSHNKAMKESHQHVDITNKLAE